MDEKPKTPTTCPGEPESLTPSGEAGVGKGIPADAGESPVPGGGTPGGSSGAGAEGEEGAGGTDRTGPSGPDLERAASIVESLLLASAHPLAFEKIGQILGGFTRQEVRKVVEFLKAKYPPESSGILVEEIARGIQLRTNPANQDHVRKLFETKPPRFTRPALETLAVIAYKQPVTRSEVEQIRGVDCAAALRTLMERRLVRVVGKKDVAGRPFLFATTREFLEVFGLAALSDLPSMRDIEDFLAARSGGVVEEAPALPGPFPGATPGPVEISELAAEILEAGHGEPLLAPPSAIPKGISDDDLAEGASLADAGDVESLTEGEGGAMSVEEVLARRRGAGAPPAGGDRFSARSDAGKEPSEGQADLFVTELGGFQEGLTDEQPVDEADPGGPKREEGD